MDDPATPHDDDDFQEVVFSGERKRAKLTPSSEPELATMCSICSAYWCNSGPHRIVSLKCGHAFGEKCVLDLIHAQGSKAACPICSELIRKSHIRPIWPTKVFLQDDCGINELKRQLEQTQATLRETVQQLEDTQTQYQQCRQNLHQLSLDQSLYSQELSELSQQQQPHQPNTKLAQPAIDVTDIPFEIADTKVLSHERYVTRVMTSIPEEEMVVTTMKQDKQNHGLYKLSLRDFRSCEYIENHTGLVRDVKHSRKTSDNGNVTLLSTGFDKTLKLTSASNSCVLLSYTLPVAGWSCEFDSMNENQFYCGLSNNSILMFDIRNTKEHLKQLYDDKTAAVPLHSMISCQLGNDDQPGTTSTLICANLVQTYHWKWGQGELMPDCNVFQAQEKGFRPYSLAFDEKERSLMVSSRGSASSSKQTVIQQSTMGGQHEMCSNWNMIWEYTSPWYQKNMVRTDLYEGIAYFSDDTGMILSRNKDGPKQTIPADHDEQIMDIKATHIQQRHLLISLTDNRIKVYGKNG